jgi:pimeloyl-ACP methyl ester carboxylesterase
MAAARFTGATAFAQAADPSTTPRAKRLQPLKSIDAGVLNVEYAELCPANGAPVILLHGWPYDIHTYVDVAPSLAAAGYRVIVPHLRGSGGTRFLSDRTPRNGQQSVIAVDVIALTMRWASRRQRLPAVTGARGRPASWLRCGRSG